MPQPVLPLPLFRQRDFSLGVAVVAFNGMVMLGGITFLPLYLAVGARRLARGGGHAAAADGADGLGQRDRQRPADQRHRRYKALPVIGTALAGSELFLAGDPRGTTGSLLTVMPALVAIGIGLGGVKNPVMDGGRLPERGAAWRNWGTATASLSFGGAPLGRRDRVAVMA